MGQSKRISSEPSCESDISQPHTHTRQLGMSAASLGLNMEPTLEAWCLVVGEPAWA